MDQEQLLFSMTVRDDAASAREATLAFGLFEANEAASPLFEGNTVGKPIKVMVEGTYYLPRKVGNEIKYREVKFSREHLEQLAQNQPRDVALNYDHKRASGPEGVKGWLRFGEGLSYTQEITTKSGEKRLALFATPEYTQETLGYVKSGVYRDVSVEYSELDEVLTGCAMTSYPRMRDVQFSQIAGLDEEQEQDQQGQEPEVAAPAPEEEDVKVEKILELPEAERKEIATALFGSLGINLDALIAKPEEPAETADARQERLMAAAEQDVLGAVGTAHFGLTDEVATQAQELLAWTAGQDTLNFGEDGTPDVKATVLALLGVIGQQGKVLARLGGDTAGTTEEGQMVFGEVEDQEQDPELDPKAVRGLVGTALRRLPQTQVKKEK